MLTLYVSGITDARDITAMLEASGREWQQITLSMGSQQQRDEWQALKQQHGWSTLPMVTDGDTLVGGPSELRAALTTDSKATRTAQALGLGGLIPFVGLAIATITNTEVNGLNTGFALLAYAATILSFVGALQWAMAVKGAARPARRYWLSVLPSLIAWVLLLLPMPTAEVSLLFAAAFVAWYALERLVSWRDYPIWFRQLRRLLTGIVATTLAIVGLLT